MRLNATICLGDDKAGHAVDGCRAQLEMAGGCLAPQPIEESDDTFGAADRIERRRALAAAVRQQHCVLGEIGREPGGIATFRRLFEDLEQPGGLLGAGLKTRMRTLDLGAATGGKLAASCLGAAKRCGNLAVVNLEDIVKQKRCPLER